MLRLRDEGLTQVQIAQRLDCDQSAVSQWLSKLADTTDTAKSYLRGSALRMAQNIVKKGRAADHVAALKGLSVLQEERTAGLVIQIGVKDSDVSITLSPPVAEGAERKGAETLAIQAGSDKVDYVNQS
jgi:predicted transcriptional regulator